MTDIYEDLEHFDFSEELQKVKVENEKLVEKINSLEKENESLSKKCTTLTEKFNTVNENISSLLKTSKGEIERKDKTILELRKQLEDLTFRRQKRFVHPIQDERNNVRENSGSPFVERSGVESKEVSSNEASNGENDRPHVVIPCDARVEERRIRLTQMEFEKDYMEVENNLFPPRDTSSISIQDRAYKDRDVKDKSTRRYLENIVEHKKTDSHYWKKSQSPGRRHPRHDSGHIRSRSPHRRELRSPPKGRPHGRGDRSPHRRKHSKSPPRKYSRSPRRRHPSPRGIHSRSPRRKRSRSPFKRQTKSPQEGLSKSPLRKKHASSNNRDSHISRSNGIAPKSSDDKTLQAKSNKSSCSYKIDNKSNEKTDVKKCEEKSNKNLTNDKIIDLRQKITQHTEKVKENSCDIVPVTTCDKNNIPEVDNKNDCLYKLISEMEDGEVESDDDLIKNDKTNTKSLDKESLKSSTQTNQTSTIEVVDSSEITTEDKLSNDKSNDSAPAKIKIEKIMESEDIKKENCNDEYSKNAMLQAILDNIKVKVEDVVVKEEKSDNINDDLKESVQKTDVTIEMKQEIKIEHSPITKKIKTENSPITKKIKTEVEQLDDTVFHMKIVRRKTIIKK